MIAEALAFDVTVNGAAKQTVQQEVAVRLARLRNDLELTLENHRLGAIQGIVVDADGTTLKNWFTEWAITQAAEVDFALGTSGNDVRGKCAQVKRQMMVASKGAWLPGAQIYGFASDGFFDAAGRQAGEDPPAVLGHQRDQAQHGRVDPEWRSCLTLSDDPHSKLRKLLI